MRQPIGLLVERAVAQPGVAVAHRHGIRCAHGLGFKQFLDTCRRVPVRGGLVPVDQQLVALAGGQQIDTVQGLLIGHQGAQGNHQVAHHALRGSGIEQGRGIAQPANQFPVGFAQGQFKVELDGIQRQAQAFDREAGQRERALLGVLPGKHHLEQRTVGRAAIRLCQFDHLLERQVLMRLRAHCDRLYPLQRAMGAACAREVDAQGQRVDEEADQTFQLGGGAVCRTRANHEVMLAGQARQHNRPSREHRHEKRHAVRAAHGTQVACQRGINRDRQKTTRKILLGRPGPVGR